MSKLLKTLIITLSIAVIAAAVYFLFLKPETPTPSQLKGLGVGGEQDVSENTESETELPTESQSKNLESLGSFTILDFWIDKSNGNLYYLDSSGQIFETTGQNKEGSNVSSQTLTNFNHLQPAPDGSAAIAEFNYPQSPTFSVFDNKTKKWQLLPTKTIAAAWSPDSKEITYLDDKGLKVLNLGTKKSRDVMALSQKDFKINWVSKSQILLSDRPSADFPGSIWSLNPTTKTLTQLLQNKDGLMVKWSPSGDQGIAFYNSGNNPTTVLIDNNASTLRTFSFVTLPEKCYINTPKIYCAIPKSVPKHATLPDDYLKRALYFEDGIYLIDLETETIVPIFEEENLPIDADHLEVHQNKLYFKNRLDGKLYKIDLE